jgi:cyclic beta-1,2-glucan synthetase
MSGIHPERGRTVFDTALRILEKENTVLLGWPALREDAQPHLGRSSAYPEGVRENGMYCHGVQWLVGAARILADQCEQAGDYPGARCYRETAYRLWLKISPIPHVLAGEIETYGGQPNKQAADMVTTFDPGRMIWHGYTGAAGWLFRQALEGVLGARLFRNEVIEPASFPELNGRRHEIRMYRDVGRSPLNGHGSNKQGEMRCSSRKAG